MIGVLRKGLTAILGIIFMYLCFFSVNQWRSESSYPIQRNFTCRETPPSIPDSNDAERLMHAMSLMPGVSKYHALMGKYYVWVASRADDVTSGQRRNLLEKARGEYLQAIFLNPAYTEVIGYLAWIDFELGEPTDAIGSLETAIKIDPNNYFNHIFYGICVSRFLDEMPERLKTIYLYRANMEFEKGVSLNPSMATHSSVLMGRADLYLKKGDIAHAVKQMEQLGLPDKENLTYHLELASSYLKLGQDEAALKKYRDIIESPGIDVQGQRIITSSLKRQTEIYPDNIELGLLLGRAYFKGQKMELALKALEKVVREKSDMSEAHYLMGRIFEAMGDQGAAYREYLKTLEYSPNHRGASEKILEYHRKGISEVGPQVP